MKVRIALVIGAFMVLPVASFGKCKYSVEAESKKNTLPVKYANLVSENKELQLKLDACKSKKVSISNQISNLNVKTENLEATKANLRGKLEAMPPASELQSEIQKLEQELGR